jgi:hypothetical protein
MTYGNDGAVIQLPRRELVTGARQVVGGHLGYEDAAG